MEPTPVWFFNACLIETTRVIRALQTPNSTWGRADTQVFAWLLIVCFLVFVLILVGGYTRLTNSGLSIVEWKPISGVVPPLSSEGWLGEFERYKQFPEYKIVNPDISLSGFKRIYWIEFIHRLIARLLAIVFLVPYLIFLARKYFDRQLALRLAFVFVLGGLQGALGWYMVQSGLIRDPSVSQYRLTAHLGLAVLIYGYLLWLTVGVLSRQWKIKHSDAKLTRQLTIICTILVLIVQVTGGFMAGTHAGFTFNTFPDMNGQLVPEGLFALSPVWRNLFENVVMIQFVHRWLAIATVVLIFLLWGGRFECQSRRIRMMLDAVMVAAIGQAVLGVSTLLSHVSLLTALAHQAGFIVLLSVLVVLLKLVTMRPGSAQV